MNMFRSQSARAFTLIELLVSVVIIGLLASLLVPNLGRIREKAEGIKCAANLRGIATAVQGYAQDNDSRYPTIEPMPSNPVYAGDEKAGTLLSVLGPYGITEEALKCPADMRLKRPYFRQEGASYMWRPMVDDELVSNPKIYHPRMGEITPPPSRLPLAADFTPVHAGRISVVFADGRVRMF